MTPSTARLGAEATSQPDLSRLEHAPAADAATAAVAVGNLAAAVRALPDIGVRLVLFGLFWGAHAVLGATVARTGAIGRVDLFDADSSPFIAGVTSGESSGPRTDTHPLFPLLFRPGGIALRELLGSEMAAAVFLTSLGGAVCVVLAHWFFRLAGLPAAAALVWSALLGVSFAQLFFSAIPETFIFSAASVIALFVILLKARGHPGPAVAATTLACGILVSNVVHGVIVMAAGDRGRWGFERVRGLVWFLILVAAGIGLLGQVQRLVYPSTSSKFLDLRYEREVRWVFYPRSWTEGIQRGKVLVRHVFVYSLVAPTVEVRPPERLPRMPRVSMYPPPVPRLHPVGTAANALWLGLIAAGIWGVARSGAYRAPEILGLMLSLAFNLVFHYFYGRELFLYAANWMFPMIGLTAVVWFRGYPPDGTMARLGTVAAAAVAVLTSVNNGMVLWGLLRQLEQASA